MPRDHQRDAQGVGGGKRNGDPLRFHRQHKIRHPVIILRRDNLAHPVHNVRRAQDIAVIKESAGQHPPGTAQFPAQLRDGFPGLFAAHQGAVAHAAGRAGHGFHLTQVKGPAGFPQQVHVLAHGGFGGSEHLAEAAQRKNPVRRPGQHPHHRAHPLIPANLIHGFRLLGPKRQNDIRGNVQSPPNSYFTIFSEC